jgi:hypothetical protein
MEPTTRRLIYVLSNSMIRTVNYTSPDGDALYSMRLAEKRVGQISRILYD